MQLSRIISVKHASWWLRGHSVSAEGFVSQSTETFLGELPLALLLVGELARGLRPGCCWEGLDFGLPVPPRPGDVWLWLLPPIHLAAHEPASLDGFEGMIPHKDSGPPRNQAPQTRVSPPQLSSPSSPARAPCLMRIWWPWAAWPGTSCPAPFPSPGTTRTTLKSCRVSEPSQH